jgi:hypothetical protein
VAAQTGDFLNVSDWDMMIRGSRAKEHDRGVSRRRQGESCVLSDGLYEWPLRQVTF